MGGADASRGVDVAVVQLTYSREETPQARLDRVLSRIEEAASADLIVLPELWSHGGFDYATWQDEAEPLDGPIQRAMASAARRHGVWLHAGAMIERDATGTMYNTSVLYAPDGVAVATYRKIHRFGFSDGEPRLLAPGDRLATAEITVRGSSIAASLTTCYDLRFPELYRLLGENGAQVALIPAAWPKSRVEHWRVLGRARAIENQVFVVQANLVGVDGDVALGGYSQIVHPDGTVLAAAQDEETVLTARLDLDSFDALREGFPVLADRRIGLGDDALEQGTRDRAQSGA